MGEHFKEGVATLNSSHLTPPLDLFPKLGSRNPREQRVTLFKSCCDPASNPRPTNDNVATYHYTTHAQSPYASSPSSSSTPFSSITQTILLLFPHLHTSQPKILALNCILLFFNIFSILPFLPFLYPTTFSTIWLTSFSLNLQCDDKCFHFCISLCWKPIIWESNLLLN